MAKAIAQGQEGAQLEPVNILLVDDQPAKLLSYQAILGELGENLICVSSAKDALSQLLKLDFAMILVDVCMPEQDGFELVETIRRHPRFREIPVIFVSAFQLTDFDRHKVYESGAVDFVSVPVVPIVLRTKVAIFADLYRKSRDLARLNQELESRVYHRTTELRQTQSALMEAGKRKDEFLAILAHELRNPLAPMQNSLELLRRLEVQEPIVESICNTFDRQLHQLTRLIDDLMDVSRITRNKLELKKDSVLLSTIVASAMESTCKRLDQARQRLVVEQPSGDVWLKADSVRLSQVITNLINNASKFSPAEKSIYLNVTVEDGEIHVSVRDEGIGMDEQEVAQVCEPFYQVNRSRELSQGGLGIGLTLVQTIVEKHDGKVQIESDGLGEGSCVTFSIPVDADTKPQPALHESEQPATRSRRFLVVDDNEDAAHTLCRLLEFLGHSVSVCYNGQAAVELAESIKPEVILMDLGMPVMDGFDAAREIRTQTWSKDMILIALTGWGQERDRKHTKEVGFDFHLVKPVTLATLEKTLDEIPRLTTAN